MFPHRRVHRLRLRASNPDVIQHAAIVVEDALGTASLPGLPPNGLLLIRRLNLGKLAANSTSISVAHRIASRLLTLNVSIVRPSSAEQPRAEVVWFPDDVEPYAILGELLVRNIQPKSWYWPRAVRGWSAQMTPQQGLRHVLFEVSRTPAGIAGAARVVEYLINGAGAETLGRTLQPDDGNRLLALGGIRTSDDITARGAAERVPDQMRGLERSWRQTFSRLVPQWGRRDDRTTWLAHVAVCARSGMPSTYAASGLVQALQQWQRGGLAVARQKQPSAPEAGIADAVKRHPPDAGDDQQRPVRGELSESDKEAKAAGPGEKIVSRVPETAGYAQAADTASTSGAGMSDRTKNAIPDYGSIQASPQNLILPDATVDHPKNRREPSDTEKSQKTPSSERSAAQQDEHQPRPRPDSADTSGEIGLAGAESKSAGLAFVVQALEWLGIRETLTAHPLLEVYQLPARILWHCVDQLGISHDNPICEFLPALEPLPAGESFDFVAPAAWQEFCGPPMSDEKILVMRRIRNTPGKRVLDSDSGKLTIALWRRQIPSAARRWVQGRILQRQPAAPPVNDLDLIVRAYVAALGCFLHQYAQTSLRRMVTRHGYVATTCTHLDVTFDQTQLDIGIRRAGLDIDPGWVPWLGRIIYIHYTGIEEIINV